MNNFGKLCTPAKIYFAIAVIAAFIGVFYGMSIMIAAWNLVFAFIWTYILGWLCNKGYTSITWVLVLLPYIIMGLALLDIYHVTHEQKQIMRAVKLQGLYGQEALTMSPI